MTLVLLFWPPVLSLVLAGHSWAYLAPDDCDWRPQDNEVALTCRLPSIRKQSTNFSLIPSQQTVSLDVICDPVFFESRLANGSLAHLRHLKQLRFEHCKFADVPDDAFAGLVELRNLTVRTHNQEWKSLALQMASHSLLRLKHLESLDLGFNNIFQLPEFLFCGLGKLKTLNLTENSLPDAGLAGLNSISDEGQPCLQELRKLDLSHNKLKHLKRGEFLRLQNLHTLQLQSNELAEVSEAALEGLRKLQRLDLSQNSLLEIPEHFFHPTPDIRELILQNNSIRRLPNSVFSGLQQLLVLNLSYNHLNAVPGELFADLIRLVVLDFSHNTLTQINTSTFQSQYSLQILYLKHNHISLIADNSFASLYNLHTLDLTGNHMTHLDLHTLNGLYVLSFLSFERNKLESIHPDAFKNCSSAGTLLLGHNRLEAVPKAIVSMQFLKHLDLSSNAIQKVTNNSVRGLKQLHRLDLNNNKIGNLSRGTFRDLPLLKYLDLSHNQIQVLEHGVFDDAPDLVTISLQDNLLGDINGLFMNLHSMRVLNVSRNKITWFDYALIPLELIQLDIHDNDVETLGNYYELESVLHLTWLDTSYNSLKEINPESFPNRMQVIRVNDNKIRIVHPFTFMAKLNLTSVDLRRNQLRNLDMNSLRLKIFAYPKSLPRFWLTGNPYFCDCTMEWLQRIHNLDDTRQYPLIEDLDEVMCQLPFARSRPIVPLPTANSSDFLCQYKSHCFALCHCCEFDACDCKMVCPENCTCYYDQTWNTNIVDCSSRDFFAMPGRIPMDVTDLYLDGNDIPQLSSHTFIGRKNMKVLYLNNSNIRQIDNRTFNGLQMLEILHLEHNKLTVLHGYEFENLTHLRELYLSFNIIRSVYNASFVSLRSLKILHLEHNLLLEMNVWQMNYNTRLVDLLLAGNPWTCECQFMEDFQGWVRAYGTALMDATHIRCFYNQTPGPFLLEFNATVCANGTHGASVPYFRAVFSEDFLHAVIVAPCVLLLVMLLLLLVVCVYRREVKVWLYSKYGVRLFQKHSRYAPEGEKLFDAFVSYCKKDEAFVAQILAPELECGPPSAFRLCLRYRDLPMSGYVAEAIQEAIECSHRTLFVLSEQFLKSEWCRFELKTAHHESTCNKNHRLIVVVLDRVSFKDLDPDSKLCLRSATVIHWGDRRFWEKLRYAMPEGNTRHSTAAVKLV